MTTPTADVIRKDTFTEKSQAHPSHQPIVSYGGIFLENATPDQLRAMIQSLDNQWRWKLEDELVKEFRNGFREGEIRAQVEASLVHSKEIVRLRGVHRLKLGLTIAFAGLVYLTLLTWVNLKCPNF